MKKLLIAFLTIMFFVGYVSGGEGNNPPPPDTSKKANVQKIESKKFKDDNKDGFNDIRDKGNYEKILKEALRERKGKK
ncbi:MAG TPA: hypothetical protein PKU94_04765 [Candidatus Hydrothermia bacterium]|nr:hypothetical protein [Candidatus Hydrothermae bacterium]MDD3648706.1 hypothetical protein [Candidatus Hydrothermia bacterium]MDD5572800.1 hypothetical protein [Candidatus Hydrothermia bacterium]HOK22434.1 hypothetical protein [Candidatus Hydrothermia bacterium]HOL23141.1 hypothetical protein [Candidatus Hydrothermia bacterium]